MAPELKRVWHPCCKQ